MSRTRLVKGEFVGRNGNVILPYLDPHFNPSHPLNSPPPIDDDPLLPLGKQARRRLERTAIESALMEWEPPHVPRSYESDALRASRRAEILRMDLSPRLPAYADLQPSSPNDSSLSRRIAQDFIDHSSKDTDFRAFAVERLHLGYHRFHLSNDTSCPKDFVLEPLDSLSVPPEEICWIMEYTENECNTIRRRIAAAMGLFPAVTDPNSPLYDAEIAWRYDRRLYCRCRRRTKRCIRPAHIEIFTSTFQTLP